MHLGQITQLIRGVILSKFNQNCRWYWRFLAVSLVSCLDAIVIGRGNLYLASGHLFWGCWPRFFGRYLCWRWQPIALGRDIGRDTWSGSSVLQPNSQWIITLIHPAQWKPGLGGRTQPISLLLKSYPMAANIRADKIHFHPWSEHIHSGLLWCCFDYSHLSPAEWDKWNNLSDHRVLDWIESYGGTLAADAGGVGWVGHCVNGWRELSVDVHVYSGLHTPWTNGWPACIQLYLLNNA